MPSSSETQRTNSTLKWALAFAALFVTAGGGAGGIYTAKNAAVTKDEINDAVKSAVSAAMSDGLDRIRQEQEVKVKEMRATISDLQTRLSREESTIASIQAEMLPRLARLEEEITKTGKDVAYIRGLLERKQ